MRFESRSTLSSGGNDREASHSAQNTTRPVAAPDEELKSNEFLFGLVESYISKVTAAGPLTLTKKIRQALGLKERGYGEVALGRGAPGTRRPPDGEGILDSPARKVKKNG